MFKRPIKISLLTLPWVWIMIQGYYLCNELFVFRSGLECLEWIVNKGTLLQNSNQ